MTVFEQALGFTLEFEGGYVNDPADLGGATNAGVTQATYNRYRAAKGLTKQPVRMLSRDELNDIYYNGYWLASHCEKMPAPVATVVFDTAVMRGPKNAIAMLQKRLGVKVDGVVGAITLAKFATMNRGAAMELAASLAKDRADFHRYRVTVNPSQQKFLRGWLRRAAALSEFIKRLQW